MSIRHVDDVMRVMQRPHDDGAQRLCFRFLQQPCVEVMIDTHDRVGEIVGDSVVHTHKTRKAPPEFAAAFVTADTHADLNGVVKHTLEVSKVSFAPIDAAVEATGMESGGMSPIGLPSGWPLAGLVTARVSLPLASRQRPLIIACWRKRVGSLSCMIASCLNLF